MIRNLILAGVSVLGLSTAAFAASDVKVQEVKVEADLSAIQNPEAAKVFTNLSEDLRGAILNRLDPNALVDKDGQKIKIDIDEVELASTWANLTDLSKSQLTGKVDVRPDDGDALKFDNYVLTVAYPQAKAFLPEGTDVSALDKDAMVYYHAMVNAFADYVVTNLK